MLVLLIHASPLYTQSVAKIQGTVTDASTGIPLAGVEILLANSGHGTVTSNDGTFSLPNLLQGEYSLHVSHIGYAARTIDNIFIKQDSPRHLFIRLERTDILMPTVRVEAARETENQPGVWTIDVESIRRSGAVDAGGLLQRAPGIDIIDEGGPGGARHISIRGSQSNQVLVLLDGVPQNDQMSGNADLSLIPANLIEKIEVRTGSATRQYGNALAGVVAITSRRSMDVRMQLQANAGAFGYRAITPSFSVHGKYFSYLLSGQYRSAQGDFPYGYRNSDQETIWKNRRNADLEAYHVHLRVNGRAGKYQYSLFIRHMDSDRGLPGVIDGWTPWARSGYQQQQLGVDYQYQSGNWTLHIQPRLARNRSENNNQYPADAELRYKRYPQYNYRDESRQTIVDNRLQWQPAPHTKVSMGYNYRHQRFTHENLMPMLTASGINVDEIAHGAWAELDFTYAKGLWLLHLTPTVRYDWLHSQGADRDRQDEQWNPALHGQISLGHIHKLLLNGAWSRTFRIPTFADLYYQDVRIDGNPDLLPERAVNKEIGLGYHYLGNVELVLNASYFRRDVHDLIVWRLGSFEVFRPYNTDALVTGSEYRLDIKNLPAHINLQCSYSRLAPLNKNNNQTTFERDLPYRPRNNMKASLEWELHPVHVQIFYHYGGARYVNEANTVSLPSYQVWDLDLGYTLQCKAIDLTLRASLHNLTDTRYTIIRNMPLPGREWRLGMGLTF